MVAGLGENADFLGVEDAVGAVGDCLVAVGEVGGGSYGAVGRDWYGVGDGVGRWGLCFRGSGLVVGGCWRRVVEGLVWRNFTYFSRLPLALGGICEYNKEYQ